MEKNGNAGVDNLSTVGALLREIEVEHIGNEDGSAIGAREELVAALCHYHSSRFSFGEALAAYKGFFAKDGGGWVAAAKVIGKAIQRNEKTIYRIVADYERASQLPDVAIVELEARGIDPAAKKNELIVDAISAMPRSEVESAPEKAVTTGIEMGTKAKTDSKALKPIPTPASKSARATKDLALVAPDRGYPKKEAYRTPDQWRSWLSSEIDQAFRDLPQGTGWQEILTVLEELMYDEWNMLEPINLTLNPHPSAEWLAEGSESDCEEEVVA